MAEESAIAFYREHPEMSESYQAGYLAHREGITAQEVAEYYSKWSDKYEKDVCPGIYNGPSILAAEIAELYQRDRENVRIIDVGAGSGFLGEQLNKYGFKMMDGLDPAEGLLELCRKKNLYQKLWCDFINDKKLPIETGTYDCVAVAGAMGEGHIPCAALHEMVRIVKPGGYVAIAMRAEYLDYVEEYKDRLEPLMAEMERASTWERIHRKSVKNYSFQKDGVVFVYRVL